MLTTGNSSPIGATVVNGGVNFSLYSRHATGVELLLFDKSEDAKPARVIGLDPHPTVPTIIGTCSCPDCSLDTSTGIAFKARSIPRRGCGLMPPKSCSIRTAAE